MAKKQNDRLGKIFTEAHRTGEDGKLQFFIVITCTEAGCKVEGLRTTQRGVNPNVYCEQFRNLGWEVASNLKKATCPQCQTMRRLKRSVGVKDASPQHDVHVHERRELVTATALQTVPENAKPATVLAKTAPEVKIPELVPPMETAMNAHTAPSSIVEFPRQETAMTDATPAAAPKGPMSYIDKMMVANDYLEKLFISVGQGAGYYLPGGSDADGAKKSELQLEQFADFRKQQCGELVDFVAIAASSKTLIADLDALKSQLDADIAAHENVVARIDNGAKAAWGEYVAKEKLKSMHKVKEFENQMARCVTKLREDTDAHFEKLVTDGEAKLRELSQTQTQSVQLPLDNLRARVNEVNALRVRVTQVVKSMPGGLTA